jgi:hypothetical protein
MDDAKKPIVYRFTKPNKSLSASHLTNGRADVESKPAPFFHTNFSCAARRIKID